MAIGERFQSSGAHGVAGFLADHQRCDAGFDVRRDTAGGGHLTISCKGCGQGVAYEAAGAGTLAAAGSPLAANGEAPPVPVGPVPAEPAPAGAPVAGPPPAEPPSPEVATERAPEAPVEMASMRRVQRRRTGMPAGEGAPPPVSRPGGDARGTLGWIPVALIALLIVGGIVMIAIGLLGPDEEPQTAVQTPSPPAAQPDGGAAPPPDGSAPQGQDAPAPAAPAESAPAAPGGPPALTLRAFPGFSLGVPAGWTAGRDGDGHSIEAPGATAAVTVFAGPTDSPPMEFARLSREFLAERNPGARLSAPRAVKFKGSDAARVVSTYGAGTETATFLRRGGTAFVVLERIVRGASPQIEQEAAAALLSFRPV